MVIWTHPISILCCREKWSFANVICIFSQHKIKNALLEFISHLKYFPSCHFFHSNFLHWPHPCLTNTVLFTTALQWILSHHNTCYYFPPQKTLKFDDKEKVVGETAKALMRGLLEEATHRLTHSGLLQHKFFLHINWNDLRNSKWLPPHSLKERQRCSTWQPRLSLVYSWYPFIDVISFPCSCTSICACRERPWWHQQLWRVWERATNAFCGCLLCPSELHWEEPALCWVYLQQAETWDWEV